MNKVAQAYLELFKNDRDVEIATQQVRDILETLHKDSAGSKTQDGLRMIGTIVIVQMDDGSIRVVRKGTFVSVFEKEMLHRLSTAAQAGTATELYQRMFCANEITSLRKQ